MSLRSTIHAGIGAVLTGAPDIGVLTHTVEKESNIDLKTGTGNNQADLLFTDQRSIGAAGNEDLDLSGVLADAFGATLTFVKVKAISIRAAAANGGNIEVSPAAANGFLGPFGDASDKLAIPAGGAVVLAAPVGGWTVTAGTGDLLNIANSDGAAAGVYDIRIVGTSA